MEGTGMPRVPADRDLPPGRKLQMKEHLMEEIRSAPRRRRRHRWVAAGLLVPAALLATLGAAKVIEGKVGDPTAARCYRTADFDGPVTIEQVVDDETPQDACARGWWAPSIASYGRYAPRLVACTGGGGDKLAWVFALPEPKGCDDLGLEPMLDDRDRPVPPRAADPAPPGYAKAVALEAAVHRRIGDRLYQGCVPVRDLEPVVRDELRRQKLGGWKLDIDPELGKPIAAIGEDPGEVGGRRLELKIVGPCAGLDIDLEAKLVSLDASYVGIPEGEPIP